MDQQEQELALPGIYEALARLLEYPQDRQILQSSLDEVLQHIGESGAGTGITGYAEFLQQSPLTELQEEYVANFDFNPVKSPYLGHHLHGEGQKKAAFMIAVKQEFGRFGFVQPGCELPDHLTVLLYFLSHLARQKEDAPRRDFIRNAVLPGVDKIISGGERCDSAWMPVIRTAAMVLQADCKEVSA